METPEFSKQYRKYYQSLEPVLKKPKTKAYSTIIFFFLVVSLFGWYAIKPTVQTILYLQREIVDKTEVNNKMDTKITALIQAQSAYDEAQLGLSLLDQSIPKEADSYNVLDQLKKLSTITQASISAIHIGPAPYMSASLPLDIPSPAVGQMPKNNELILNLTATGQYQSILDFITGIINMRRLAMIDSIQITKGNDTGYTTPQADNTLVPDLLTINIRMKTYYAFAPAIERQANP